MKTFSFTVVLAETELTQEQAEDLFATGCDDATPGVFCGQAHVDFDRKAKTLAGAIESAIKDIEDAGLTPARLEPGDFVTQAEIAERCGQSRQSISNYVSSKRGKTPFPRPAARMMTSSPLWRWTVVSKWLAARHCVDKSVVEEAETLAHFDEQLRSREVRSVP